MLSKSVLCSLIQVFLILIGSFGQYFNPKFDVFFEILHPNDISYTFHTLSGRGLGADFDEVWKGIYLIPAKPLKCCSRLVNNVQVKNNIVLVERGECSFTSKSLMAEEAGAVAMIVIDSRDSPIFSVYPMNSDITGRQGNIPATLISYQDGYLILESLIRNKVTGALINIPLNLTYDEKILAKVVR